MKRMDRKARKKDESAIELGMSGVLIHESTKTLMEVLFSFREEKLTKAPHISVLK